MISRFFIDRPIFATVLSAVIVILGLVALSQLPIAQYPDVAPPTVQVTATYPGANAVTVAETVATPIEQEINGVERMLYMSSKCTNDGQMNLDVTFELGTNLDTAQVLVQNRVAVAEAKLPEEVKRIGVTTKKKSPSILMCVNLISPDGRYDQLYLSNFALLSVKDDLARIKGVGDVSFLGPRDYSMRIWLDPNKLASLEMTASDVIRAIKEQNVQVAAGRIGQPPIPGGASVPFQLPLNVQGRLTNEQQFEDIVVKRGEQGQVVYLRDVVREKDFDETGRAKEKGIELGAKNYDVNSYLDGQPSVTLAVFQLPGSNALNTAQAIRDKMAELKSRFPEGAEYRIEYDTTIFVSESIASVYHTLIEAFVLVFIVVLVFLQNWRATIVPMIAVPVSLIGTFAFMAMFGFSLNNLSLFGLVLAIGIVVDDAIVVVENVERLMALGLSPREASRKAMDEVTAPVIAISMVLCSVFVPTAFMAGISGEFFKQFALTIAASTVISAFNSLTLSPALCALLLKSHGHADEGHGAEEHKDKSHGADVREALPPLGIAVIGGLLAYVFLPSFIAGIAGLAEAPLWMRIGLFVVGAVLGWLASRPINWGLNKFFGVFNWFFDVTIAGYGWTVGLLMRLSVIVLCVYGGLMFLTVMILQIVPIGFIPEQDKGYLVVNAQLPDGANLDRSDALIKKLSKVARETEGVAHTIDLAGYSTILSTNISNVGGMFVILAPFEERAGKPELSAPAVIAKLRKKFSEFQEAQIAVFGAPPVEGLGSTGGFKLQVQDRRSAGLPALQGAVQNFADEAVKQPGLVGVFSTFSVAQPQLFAEIDREKAKAQSVSLDEIHSTLQTYLGSSYVNDFSFQNRNWQVNVQADPRFRMRTEDIGKLEVRNAAGVRVPLGTLIKLRNTSGPPIVNHYNLYPSAELNGATAGVSSGQAITMMDSLGNSVLPATMGYEWTELTLQQILASKDVLTKLAFPLGVLFVFLVLSAQYESWSLPVAIILIVPMCLLAALTGVWLAKLDNNIFVQIGLVVLIGLAAKNAILIVEFAKQLQDTGKPCAEATQDACRLRLRPILMTSFAFILGVVPLVLAKGAGAEMRFTLGLSVFSGMLGVTVFGIFFTPVFYYVVRWATGNLSTAPVAEKTPPGGSADSTN